MEELLARHRKEARDLQSKITQKKKSASKKTRKGVNDECDQLERELKERHQQEIAALSGAPATENDEKDAEDAQNGADSHESQLEANTEQLAKLSVGTSTSASTTAPDLQGQKKPNRQKARLARRAAEQEALAEQAAAEAVDIPDLKEQERKRMLASFKKHELTEKEIRADGHCLYSAIADQLGILGIGLKPRIAPTFVTGQTDSGEQPPYKIVRSAAADYIEEHSDDFEAFLEEPLFTYVHKVRDTATWGGQLELLALARTYGVDINVLQGDGQVTKIEGGESDENKKIWLAYYRHNFGLGEHYNSLRKSQ